MMTVRPAHSAGVHVLSRSSSVVLVCLMTYPDEPSSGVRSQAGDTVSVLSVLDNTVRVWPAPKPAVILTGRPAHWLTSHVLLLSLSVVLDCAPSAVPASPLPVPLSPATSVPSSANTVPPAAVAAPKSVEPLSVTLKIPFSPPRVVLVKGPQKAIGLLVALSVRNVPLELVGPVNVPSRRELPSYAPSKAYPVPLAERVLDELL